MFIDLIGYRPSSYIHIHIHLYVKVKKCESTKKNRKKQQHSK